MPEVRIESLVERVSDWWPPENRVNVYQDFVDVGWGSVGVLKHDDPQTMILTDGVANCYVLFGINQRGDVVMGHHYEPVPIEVAESRASYHLRQRNLDPSEFNFLIIPGPNHHDGDERDELYYSYNIQFSRSRGLEVIKN